MAAVASGGLDLPGNGKTEIERHFTTSHAVTLGDSDWISREDYRPENCGFDEIVSVRCSRISRHRWK